MRWTTLALVAFLATGTAACSDDEPAGPGGGGVTLEPALNSGADQIAAPGQTFANPIQVQVLVDGVPAGGVEVQFTPNDGTVSPATATSGANGIASTTWTLGGAASIKGSDGMLSSAEVARVVSVTASVPGLEVGTVKVSAFLVPASHAVVEVINNEFIPNRPSGNTAVAPGTSVTWVWVSDADNHNVAPTNGSKQPVRSGETRDGPFVYTQIFADAGTYTYECEAHGSLGMTGSVLVSTAP